MKRNIITLDDLRKTKCAHLNPWLFEGITTNKKKVRSKYLNEKIEFDDKLFDSKKELDRYITLRMRLVAGEISGLRCQVAFYLESNNIKVSSYIADYVYTEMKTGGVIVEDVKSPVTRRLAAYRLKRKLMKAQYNVDIKEM